MAHGRRVTFDYAVIDVRHPARTSSHAAKRIPFAVKWKIHGSIMPCEQANAANVRASRMINGRETMSIVGVEPADELNEQIALVADIEGTRRYSDVAGKWETTRRTSSNPRIRRGVSHRQLRTPNEIVSPSLRLSLPPSSPPPPPPRDRITVM